MKQYFRYFLVIIFFAAITVIVFLQFNSNRNIDRLISGNEDVLQSQGIRAELNSLEGDLFALDAKTRTFIIKDEKDEARYQALLTEAQLIEKATDSLQRLQSEPSLSSLLKELNTLVNRKLNINKNLLDTFYIKGKGAAEHLISNYGTGRTMDSIAKIGDQINALHQQYATRVIDEADVSGRKAKTFGTTLALLAILASMITFSYVTLKMMEQRKMIEKLNVSEQKARESAIIKEHFLANMSHEIRTPLNAILGFGNLLRNEKMSEDAGKYVSFINLAGDNLLNIVNDVLDLSKIEAGMLRIESSPFDFGESIEKVISIYREKALEKKLQFITNINPSVPRYLSGDAARLNQVITNLIGNSLKFTDKGKITIECTLAQRIENKAILSIIISDTGIGIKQEQLAQIFERFHQSDETVSRKYGGTGLGLAIVQDLVKLMKGTIEVSSNEGAGTTFKLIIPFLIVANGKLHEVNTVINDYTIFDASQKVLIVEDNEINQSLMRHLLSSWKVNFDIAANGSGAIEKLKHNSYSLVLMDIQMPGMDGYATTIYIRKELTAAVPIIAMTAHAITGEKEKCLQHGMNDYTSKPIDPRELKSLLAKYLSLKPETETIESHVKTNSKSRFVYLNTEYLKSISLGNKEYEKAVTSQFIEMVPEELSSLKNAWATNETKTVKEIAHSLKTTVSIMGIMPLIDGYLNNLEHQELDEILFQKNFESLNFICMNAVEEAQVLLRAI